MPPNPLPVSPDLAPADLPPAVPAATRHIRLHGTLSRVAAVTVGVAAVAVLFGWLFGVEVLKHLYHPARIAMNPVTAVCLVALAVAGWLVVDHPVSRGRRQAASALAFGVLVVAFLKLATLLGLSFHVDRLVLPDRVGHNGMPVGTAVTFAVLACGVMLTDSRVGKMYPAPWLAVCGLAGSLTALLAYAYNIVAPHDPATGVSPAMALNTAVCFYVLALGLLAARPDQPPLSTVLSDSVGGLVSRRLLPAAILMPALVGYGALAFVRRGGTGPESAVLIFTLTTIVVFVGLTAWTADRLHRLDLSNRSTLRKLQRAEAVYHSLVETLPQNIFRKDVTGKFTFGNSNFCHTLGRQKDEIAGKTDFDFYGPELAARYRHDDLDVIRTGTTRDVVEEHVTPAGDRLYVQVIKTPVRSPDGEVIGVQGIFWDVTDRVVAQQELERKNKMLVEVNANLEDANNQLGLANARLYETNLQLEQANDRLERAVASERAAREQLTKTQTHLVQSEKMVGLGQMVAGVAHEINNPLAFVNNNVAVLQRDVKALGALIDLYKQADGDLRKLKPELMTEVDDLSDSIDLAYTRQNIDDLIARSREGLRRIQQIVRDLRDFVRLDESELQEVNLNDGVESTLNIILGHAKKKQIKLEKDLGELPPLTCYPAKVNQVIMNLVGNAIDASNEGGRVTIRTRPAGAPPDRVVLEVADEGCGVPADLKRRIFDPFFTTKPVGQGTGLGLSISYGIVRDHGGEIEVDSEPGKGSCFRVTLPLTGPAKAAADEVDRQTAKVMG
ncbi:MAG TPA: ATP-binding protein [Humisphaera sp.]